MTAEHLSELQRLEVEADQARRDLIAVEQQTGVVGDLGKLLFKARWRAAEDRLRAAREDRGCRAARGLDR